MDGCCPISSEILPSIHNNLMGRSCHNGDPMMPFSPDRQAFNAFTAHLKIVDIFTHGQAVFFSLLPRRGIFSSNHRIKNRWQLLFLFKFVPLRDWDFVSSTKEYFFIEKYHPFFEFVAWRMQKCIRGLHLSRMIAMQHFLPHFKKCSFVRLF